MGSACARGLGCWPSGDRWGSLLALLLVAACGGDRDASRPARDRGSVATRGHATTAAPPRRHRGPARRRAGHREHRRHRRRQPAASRQAAVRDAAKPPKPRRAAPAPKPADAQAGTPPSRSQAAQDTSPGHHRRTRAERAAARRLPSGAEGHRRSGDLRRLEAVQPELRPLSRRGRAGHDHRPAPHRVPQARRTHQYPGAVRPDRLRRPPGEGHAVVVRAGDGSGEDQPDLFLREGPERGEDRPGPAGGANRKAEHGTIRLRRIRTR